MDALKGLDQKQLVTVWLYSVADNVNSCISAKMLKGGARGATGQCFFHSKVSHLTKNYLTQVNDLVCSVAVGPVSADPADPQLFHCFLVSERT